MLVVVSLAGIGAQMASVGRADGMAAASDSRRLSVMTVKTSVVYPIAVAGLQKTSNGATTLWLLNIEPKSVLVSGSDIYGIVDVQFTGKPGVKFKIKKSYGNNCALQTYPAAPGSGGVTQKIECLPEVAPASLTRLLTFTTSGPFPTDTLIAGVPSQTAYIGSTPLAHTVRTPQQIRHVLEAFARSEHLRNTTVFVAIKKSKPFTYVLSQRSARAGWVTFVFTNYAKGSKTFEICQYSDVVGDACAGLASDPNEDATALVPTGTSEYFAILLDENGKALYHSWNGGAEKGLRGTFGITP